MNATTRRVVAFNLAFGLLLLGLCELLVRGCFSPNNRFEVRASYNLRYGPSGFARQVLVPDQQVFALDDEGLPRLDFRRYRINSRGWRGEEWPLAKEEGELRVVFLGGSHVFDLFCEDEDGCPGWPALVEQALAARWPHRKVRVFNGGAPGQDSRSFPAQVALEWSRFAPDLMVFDSAWNDLKWIARYRPEEGLLGTPPGAPPNPLIEAQPGLDRWLGWSAAYRKVRDRVWALKLDLREGALEGRVPAAAEEASAGAGFARYAAILRSAGAAAVAIGARPVFAVEERLVAPANTEDEKKRIALAMVGVADHAALLALYAEADRIHAVLAADYPVVDLNPRLAAERGALFRDHVHTTPEGSRRLAALWAEELASRLAP